MRMYVEVRWVTAIIRTPYVYTEDERRIAESEELAVRSEEWGQHTSREQSLEMSKKMRIFAAQIRLVIRDYFRLAMRDKR